MQNKKLPDEAKVQELKNEKFVSKTAKALLIVILFAAVFLIIQPVFAQNDSFGLQSLQELDLPSANLGVVVARIINAALGLLGLVAVTIILYGGFTWMTARGEVEKVQKAKKILIQASIGLLIVVFSFAIAQFVFFLLGINVWGGGDGGTGGAGGTGGGGGGALGAGIIRSHYPARNAKDVPRNTKIVITFKEAICVTGASSFIDKKVEADLNDDVSRENMILVYPRPVSGSTTKASIAPANIKVYHTADNKTFTFKPVDPLGNAQTPTNYVVELTNNLKKADCTTPAFGSFGGYIWGFQVSTFLDLTPPKIESVIPRAALNPVTVARNTVIQINFNEAIDPTTLSGKLAIEGDAKTGALTANSFDLMTVKAANDFVAGEFYFSNQYRTVEFITNDPCGKNSCGKEIFCLPGDSAGLEITVLLKAATLAEAGKPGALEKPELLTTKGVLYDGLVDMCSNSLDGNGNGTADGPRTAEAYSLNKKSASAPNNNPASAGDNANWKFFTNDLIDLIPPQVEARNPDKSVDGVNPDNDLNLAFSKILLASSLLQEESLTLEQPDLSDSQKSGYDFSVDNNDEQTKSAVTINIYSGLIENHVYNIIAESGIKDNTQNCFLPCSDLSNCARAETETPGQYTVGTPWTGNYPNCNLIPAP